MVSRICVYVVLLSLTRLVLAQEDTVQLEAITVSALQFERFTTGSQLQPINFDVSSSLEKALSQSPRKIFLASILELGEGLSHGTLQS